MTTAPAEPPVLGDREIEPYPYQAEAVCNVLAEFRRVASTLVVMPTGTGKTETALFAALCTVEEGGRALFLAHTDELVQQPREKALRFGMTAAVEKAGEHACPHFTQAGAAGGLYGDADPRLVVASVPTLQGKRLAAWPPGHFDLIVTDEAHHASATTYRNVIDHFRPRWHLGVTATAVRGDGGPLVGKNQVFETLAFTYPITRAVAEGWLARPRFGRMDMEIDLGSLRVKDAKDLRNEDIDKILLPYVEPLANELREKLEGHRAVIFTPMVVSAQRLAWALDGLGVSTGWLSGESKDRATVLSEFRSGRTRHLVNAMVLTEGFDAPFVDTVVILRPTKSWSLFVQMAGRCLRRYPGKAGGLILGVNWRNFQNLVHPVDILCDADTPAEARGEARSLVDSGAEADLFAALKRGEAVHKEREVVRHFRVREHAARAAVEYADPLGFDPDFAAPTPEFRAAAWDQPPTDKQASLCVKLGMKEADAARMTKASASRFIGEQFARRDKGLATYKQVKTLTGFRVPDAGSLSKAEASQLLDGLMAGRR